MPKVSVAVDQEMTQEQFSQYLKENGSVNVISVEGFDIDAACVLCDALLREIDAGDGREYLAKAYTEDGDRAGWFALCAKCKDRLLAQAAAKHKLSLKGRKESE